MRETAIVDQIRRFSSGKFNGKQIIKGIGDDCAVLRPRSGEDLVFTTDFVLEGRHFTLDTHTAADIGYKALARSLSDLAAMGSEPVFCLVSLAVPAEGAARRVKGFYRGLLSLASKYKITVAGGDLSRFEKMLADVICCGRVPSGRALLRSGAQPGDQVYVTGELGGSAHGLATRSGKSWRRHLRPEPLIEAGIALRKLGVTACMDLSDGLSLDLARLCRESNCSAEIRNVLPVAKGATFEQALHGGEDYELLFTAPPNRKIPPRIAQLPITRIGQITRGKSGQAVFEGRLLKSKGFDHFA